MTISISSEAQKIGIYKRAKWGGGAVVQLSVITKEREREIMEKLKKNHKTSKK